MREVRFEVDGESVAGKLHEATGEPVGQLVLVHGLLSQGLEFADLPERLAAKGFRVLALDQRGFGASGGPRGIITQERATADILAAVALLRKDRPGVPVGLVGHSMGAVFTLRALAEDPTIQTAVLGSPMLTVRAELKAAEFQMYKVAYALSRITTRTPLGPVRVPYKYDYDRLFHDKEAARRAKANPFLHPTVDLTNYPAFIAMDASREAARVKQPVLVILAEHDRAVRRSSSMAVYDRLAGEKELVSVASGHSMWADSEAERAADHVERWMRAHLT